MEPKKYIWGDTEITLTGRKATKEIAARSNRSKDKVFVLHEITPADQEEGSWKKWVKITDLYEIGDD